MASRNLSLAQHLATGQLPLFMSAKEIMTHYEPHEEEYESGEDTSQLWDRKLRESKETPYKGSTRFKIFKNEGVKHPVEIGFPAYLDRGEGAIYEGHHRVASMNKINPDRMLPVAYLDPKEY